MNHVFVDTDVTIDFLTMRPPFGQAAWQLFNLVAQDKLQISISTLSVANMVYILRKHDPVYQRKIEELTRHIVVEPLSIAHLNLAFASNFNDFEDALQHAVAVSTKGVSAILTRNIKDYKQATIPVLTPDVFLAFDR